MTRLLSALSIRAKLGLAFGFVFLVTLALGLFAMRQMARMDAAAEQIRGNYLPSVAAIGELNSLVQQFRIGESRHVLTTDDAAMRAEEKAMGDLAAAYSAARKAFEPMIDPGEEAERFKVIDELWGRYLRMHDQLVALSSRNETEAAAGLFKNAMTSTFTDLSKLFKADVAYNHAQGSAAADAGAALYASTWTVTLVAIGGAALATLAVWFSLARGISVPLARISHAMGRLAERDMSTAIPGTGRRDEIGGMAAAVQVFKDSMIKSDELAAAQEADRRAKDERSARLEGSVHDFEGKVGGLVSMLSAASTEMEATAQSMSSTATQTSQQASTVAAAAGEAGAGVQTVAAAAEELTASIQEISRQVAQSAQVTDKAVTDARRTDTIVRALAEGAQKIGQVVQLITNIAGQTNLLALNATIEAARAGDAGKGFAVVASEVKNLAHQTAKATDEIGAQIGHIQSATAEAVEAIRDIGATIEEVNVIATAIASAVEEQGAATAEIARNVQQTAGSTQEVTANISGVSQAAEETGAAASQVLGTAGDLSQQSARLAQVVQSFVAVVRAA